MNRLFVYLTFLMTLVMSGCASETQVTPASRISDVSMRCISSRATINDETSEMTRSQGVQSNFSTLLTLIDGVCYVEINGIRDMCGVTHKPEVKIDEDQIIIILDRNSPEPVDCMCNYKLSFKFNNVSPGIYRVIVGYKKGMILDVKLNNPNVELFEGEPVKV